MTIISRKPAPKKKAKAVKKAATKKVAPKKPAKKTAAPKAVAKKKAPVKKTAAKTAVAKKKAAAKKPVAKKAPVRKAPAPKSKAAPKKTAAPAKTPVAKKVPAPKISAPKAPAKPLSPSEQLLAQVKQILEDGKAEDIVAIDMADKSAIADFMVIATGRSQRQLAALAEHLRSQLKLGGRRLPNPEGLGQGDWVLLDAGDVIVHLFRPEVRAAYNLEKMWSQPLGEESSGMEGLIKERPLPSPHAERMAQQQAKTFRPDFRHRGSNGRNGQSRRRR